MIDDESKDAATKDILAVSRRIRERTRESTIACYACCRNNRRNIVIQRFLLLATRNDDKGAVLVLVLVRLAPV